MFKFIKSKIIPVVFLLIIVFPNVSCLNTDPKPRLSMFIGVDISGSFLRGKYGSMAAKDWIKNIGKKKRRWFTSEVEFLQNGDYDRKAQLYITFPPTKQKELR